MAPSPNTALQDSAPQVLAQISDIFQCQTPCEDAFLFVLDLDNAPYILYETMQNAPPYTGNASFANTGSPDALFLLTTLTCYHAPVAEWLSNALAKHYRFSPALAMCIRTALHEAIANAVIHGNLGIHGRFQGMKGFDAYCAHIRTRLGHPPYLFARISIALLHRQDRITLYVSDEGDGYQDDTGGSHCDASPPGQGLSIIRKHCSDMRVLHGGRAIEMDFAL